MKLRIDVTAEDIAKGNHCRANACPVALAVARAGLRDVSVFPDSILFGPRRQSGWRDQVAAPRSVGEFIEAYDTNGGSAVSPFSFEIDVPDAPASPADEAGEENDR